MGSRLPQQSHRSASHALATPVKQQLHGEDQYSGCPYGSPVSGLCTGQPAAAHPPPAAAATSGAKTRLRPDTTAARPKSVQRQQPGVTARPASSYAAQQQVDALACRTSSMPELWQAASRQQQAAQPGTADLQLRLSADNRPRRDQDHSQGSLQQPSPRSSINSNFSGPRHSLQGSPSAGAPQQLQVQQQALLPVDVLLSALLPSADEAKLVDRLSQLRHALDEHVRLAAGWEQQAMTLQSALSEVQEESLVLRGQVASQQHHISLLGGNLHGRLSLVQGSVLAQMQEQVSQKDAALAASTQHVLAIQAELERLSCSYAAKLAAEQAERQRLSAEAAQARLLCTARGRQVASLQQELQQLRDAATQQQQTAAASTSVQQQQLEGLRERLQDTQRQLADAQQAAAEAQQMAAAAEGGKSGLRQQVEELQALLADRQLQLEWLEGKVADLEDGDASQQLRRHQSEVGRLQEAAAAERRALEQQLAASQRQLAQLQQKEQGRQQQLEQLEQQAQHLQQQLAQQQAVSQELEQQQVRSGSAEAELVHQLTMADAELQQLREQLAEAEEHVAALTQQLQEQQEQQQHGLPASADLDPVEEQEGGGGGNGSPRVPAAVVHALRAELGMANAEVARLRHQLDVSQASQQQERELTGHEILRLQQELSEAAASGSGSAAAAGDGGAAAADEVTSRLGANRVCSSSTSSWHSVHENPAFEQVHPQPQQQASELQALLVGEEDEECGECKGEGLEEGQQGRDGSCSQVLVLQDAAADVAAPAGMGAPGAASKLSRYEAKLQDQADTISSLQRQLKQQEQLLVALQKRERRVYDSAASKGSWAEALGFEEQRHLPAHLSATVPEASAVAAAAAAASSVHEPATPQADAAVQTDLSGPAESAGSTAAAPAATASEGVEGQQQPRHAEQQASSRQQQVAAAAVASEAGASSALLAAARHEILRLQELNRQLMQAHAEELKASVSFDDARRAVSEAKQHAKAKAAALLQSSNKTWSDKLAAARADAQLLHEQLQDMQLQRDQLAQQLSSASQTHAAAVLQLQQELAAAQQHSQALTRQLRDMADSHVQELEQVRMEVEADAAAAMLDAAAASNKLERQQQRASCSTAVQTAAAAGVEVQHAAVQTGPADSEVFAQQQQQQQAPPAASSDGGAQMPAPPHQPQVKQQHLQRVGAADNRPCTPQPAAASPAAAPSTAEAELAPEPSQTPQQQRLAPSWRSAAAAAGAADAADDEDICRFSSASDTPASASSRGPISRVRAGAWGGAAAADASRPDSAGAASLPECMPTRSPIAPGLVKAAAAKGGTLLAQQQAAAAAEQQQAAVDDQHWQQQQQQQQQQHSYQQQLRQDKQRASQQQQAAAGPAQMSTWHAELLQQQAELEALRTRLSQQRQQPLRPVGGPTSSSRGSPAVAHSKALLLAPFGPVLDRSVDGGAAADGGSVASLRGDMVSSPAGPVVSSSSPLTYQQRRAAAAAAAAAAAGGPRSSSGLQATEASSTGLLHQGRPLSSLQQPGEAAAGPQQGTRLAAVGFGAAEYTTRWRSSSSPDGLNPSDSLLMGSPQPSPAAAGSGAGAGRSGAMQAAAVAGSWGLSLTAAAAARSVSPAEGASHVQPTGVGPAAAVGLSQLGHDVLGALSLSRYHRERSKLQEARAKQHALMASHHEDQAAALRNSRLGAAAAAAGTAAAPAGGVAAAGPAAAGVSPGRGPGAWAGGGAGGNGSRLL